MKSSAAGGCVARAKTHSPFAGQRTSDLPSPRARARRGRRLRPRSGRTRTPRLGSLAPRACSRGEPRPRQTPGPLPTRRRSVLGACSHRRLNDPSERSAPPLTWAGPTRRLGRRWSCPRLRPRPVSKNLLARRCLPQAPTSPQHPGPARMPTPHFGANCGASSASGESFTTRMPTTAAFSSSPRLRASRRGRPWWTAWTTCVRHAEADVLTCIHH
mmetsp:Transcript_2602/g.7819  ORF Transcript_2602/g.7819 Transcript_2602/m.7819 type:complete len:215 (+) Transcript_2602:544-1188(+)